MMKNPNEWDYRVSVTLLPFLESLVQHGGQELLLVRNNARVNCVTTQNGQCPLSVYIDLIRDAPVDRVRIISIVEIMYHLAGKNQFAGPVVHTVVMC